MEKINDKILESLYRESDVYIPKGDAKDSAPIKAVDLMSRKDSLKNIGIDVTNEKGVMIFLESKENGKDVLLAERINRDSFLDEYKKPSSVLAENKKIQDFMAKIANKKPNPYYTLANQSKQENRQEVKTDKRRKQGF